MPNGGQHHCSSCRNFTGVKCELRNADIFHPAWTTCRNWNREAEDIYGPIQAILCQVEDGNPCIEDKPNERYISSTQDKYLTPDPGL